MKAIVLLDPKWPEKKWLKGSRQQIMLSFNRSKMWACLLRHRGAVYIVDAHGIQHHKIAVDPTQYVSRLVTEQCFPQRRKKDGSFDRKKPPPQHKRKHEVTKNLPTTRKQKPH